MKDVFAGFVKLAIKTILATMIQAEIFITQVKKEI